MKKSRFVLAGRCAGLIALLAAGVQAEYTFFTPPGSFTVEVSLENSPWLRLPVGRNAIVSLDVVGDRAIGGTSAEPGRSPYIFAVSLSKRELVSAVDVGSIVPGQRSVQSGFGRGGEGVLFAGTMPDRPGGGGHILAVSVVGEALRVEDRGIPVAGEGVFALASDAARGKLYGVVHPSGRFFVRDIRTGDTRVFAETAITRRTLGFVGEYSVGPDDVLCRRLAIDRDGRVYGSIPLGKLFRFDPAKGAIDLLPGELPEGWGRKPLARVDSWVLGPDGSLFGGNAGDGELFRLDPKTGAVTNLGKPSMMPRLKGLAFGADGRLYGVAGAPPGYTHLFSFEAGGKGFVDLGNPRFTMTSPGIEQGIAWRGFRIGTLAASEDGRYIVMGEEEALSQLMVFSVDARH
jgi:hypothetical protein